ncbi:hypothetical protein, partial [Aeromonas veronii]|uniref:hypothetical protein n=1 Tax=Aeromonas veronii TaxID=654 RepID=UPI00406D4462
VGQRPRGIDFTRDGKFVMVAVGDDDTIQMIDAKTQAIVDTLPYTLALAVVPQLGRHLNEMSRAAATPQLVDPAPLM